MNLTEFAGIRTTSSGIEDVRGKLSTPQIHNASHAHRVNPITRLNGVKHAPQPTFRMTFTHGRASAYGEPVSTVFPVVSFR